MSGDVRLSTREATIEVALLLAETHVTISRLMTEMTRLQTMMLVFQADDRAAAAKISEEITLERGELEVHFERTFLALEDLLKRLGDENG